MNNRCQIFVVLFVHFSFYWHVSDANNRYGMPMEYDSESSPVRTPMRYEQPPTNTGAHHIFADQPTCFERCDLVCEPATVYLNNNQTTWWNCRRLRPVKTSLLKLTSSGTSLVMIVVGCIVVVLVTFIVCCAIINCCRATGGTRGGPYPRKGEEMTNDEFIEVKPGQQHRNGNSLLLPNGHDKTKRFVAASPKIDTISEV